MNKLSIKGQNAQAGFTLIELIVVIVILGVLAATALPKFADLGGDARAAKMQAAAGAMKSAAATFHAQWMVAGSAASGTISQEGTAITIKNGYPDALTIAASAGLGSEFSTSNPTTTTLLVLSDTNHAACNVTYTEAAAGGAPVVTVGASLTSCK